MTSHSHITSIEDIQTYIALEDPILCLFSGGLDGTYLLFMLHQFGYKDVLALTVDVGQPAINGDVRKIAESFGAKWQCLDAKYEFVNNYVFPSVFCNATYLGGHPISASLTRPLMAQKAVHQAMERKCTCILHTSNASQNSFRRFNTAIKLLEFPGVFGSPFIMSNVSRSEKILQLKNVGISWDEDKLYSVDENLWIHEFEYGDVDNPESFIIPKSLLKWTIRSSTESSELTIRFEKGKPVALNGMPVDGIELILRLNTIVGSYGHGRYVWLEELPDGRKVQEIREAPAAQILFDAYRRLESAILSAEEIREKLHIEQLWVREASEGRWFGKLRKACQAFTEELSKHVTGEIRYVLSTGGMAPNSLKAEQSLYIINRQNYEKKLANNWVADKKA